MKRRIVIALLGLGVVAGYGSGIAQVVHGHHACGHSCSGWHHDRDRDRGRDQDRDREPGRDDRP